MPGRAPVTFAIEMPRKLQPFAPFEKVAKAKMLAKRQTRPT